MGPGHEGPDGGGRGAATFADRVNVVQQLAERLTRVVTVEDVVEAITAELPSGLGASAFTLAVVDADGESLATLATAGVSEETRRRMSGRFPLDSWRPARTVVTGGRPLLWSSLADRDRDYPEFVGYPSAARSWAVLPLMVHGVALGVLSVGWPDEHPFPALEAAILQVIAHQCAVAIDRAHIEEVRRAERETLELLSEGTRVMVSALDPRHVIEVLVDLAVPRLAPWCAVYVAEGRALRRVALRIEGDPSLAAELRGQLAGTVGDRNPLAEVFRSGEPGVFTVTEAVVGAIYGPGEGTPILDRVGTWTSIAVPVTVAGKSVGVMSLVSPDWARSVPDQVRFAAEGLAARAGIALANARRFDDERRSAEMLMEAFLPAELPEIPGFAVAARYLPATSKVAGDWYDVVRLPSGSYLVGIGDAGGHGIPAASLMGQLRNCARGLALTGHQPGAILDALHLVAAADSPDSFATAVYGILDPSRHEARWASAGHLPPIQYRAGEARYLEQLQSPPLGSPAPPSRERVERWDPGNGVVLVTDGVVERRLRDLGEGMEALRRVVARYCTDGPDALTDAIAGMCDSAEDDCCVLVLQRTGVPVGP